MNTVKNIESGSTATIRHFSLESPSLCLIDTISDTGDLINVLVRSTSEITEGKILQEGDPVVLTISGSSGAGKTTYVVTCTIISIKNNMLTLAVDEVMPYHDERKNKRYITSYAGSVTFKGQTKFAMFKNISKDGCLIVTEHCLKDGHNVLIKLNPDQLTTIEFNCTVVRSRKINDFAFEYGLQITYISPSNSPKFDNVFKELSKIEEEEVSALRLLKLKGGI